MLPHIAGSGKPPGRSRARRKKKPRARHAKAVVPPESVAQHLARGREELMRLQEETSARLAGRKEDRDAASGAELLGRWMAALKTQVYAAGAREAPSGVTERALPGPQDVTTGPHGGGGALRALVQGEEQDVASLISDLTDDSDSDLSYPSSAEGGEAPGLRIDEWQEAGEKDAGLQDAGFPDAGFPDPGVAAAEEHLTPLPAKATEKALREQQRLARMLDAKFEDAAQAYLTAILGDLGSVRALADTDSLLHSPGAFGQMTPSSRAARELIAAAQPRPRTTPRPLKSQTADVAARRLKRPPLVRAASTQSSAGSVRTARSFAATGPAPPGRALRAPTKEEVRTIRWLYGLVNAEKRENRVMRSQIRRCELRIAEMRGIRRDLQA